MNAYLSTASLVLYPQSPHWCPENPAELITHLRATGFAGEAIDATHDALTFFAGEQFLEQITFMGCAPNIRFAPDEASEKFTHIRLHHYQHITALAGAHTRAPNCPQCKKAFTTWNTQLESLAENTQWTCEHCQHSAAPWNYQWRKSAGFGRVFIEVTDIYPKEAVPQSGLLDSLEQQSGISWLHAYIF